MKYQAVKKSSSDTGPTSAFTSTMTAPITYQYGPMIQTLSSYAKLYCSSVW